MFFSSFSSFVNYFWKFFPHILANLLSNSKGGGQGKDHQGKDIYIYKDI